MDILHGASVLRLPITNTVLMRRILKLLKDCLRLSKALQIMESSRNDCKKLTFMDFLILIAQVQLKILKSTYRYYLSLGSEIFVEFK